jgi:hypothetical protein
LGCARVPETKGHFDNLPTGHWSEPYNISVGSQLFGHVQLSAPNAEFSREHEAAAECESAAMLR